MDDRLGAYWLGASLGNGAVREAYDQAGSRYALMLLPKSADRSSCRRAQTVTSLYVAKLVDADLEGERPYVVSEYVPGPTLRQVVAEQGPYGCDELYRLASATVTALAAVHEAGTAHGAVDPDHVLLGPEGPRLIGLGAAGAEEGPPADIAAWAELIEFAAGGELDRALRELVGQARDPDPGRRPDARRLLLSLLDAPQSQQGRLLPPEPVDDPPLGERAEQVYLALPSAEQELVPEILLRLVEPGETRCSVPRADLGERAEPVLQAYGEAGLLTVTDTVTITHPALVRAWPRLREWLDGEREGLAVHRELAQAARRWDTSGRRDADLIPPAQVDKIVAWAATARRHVTLSDEEQEFLDAGTARSRRRARTRLAVVAGGLVLALLAAGLALWQTGSTGDQLDETMARLAASKAEELRVADPVTARRLSLAAWKLAPVEQAADALRRSATDPALSVFTDPGADERSIHSLSDDGSHLAAVTNGVLRVYDVRTGEQLVAKNVPEKIRALAWEPDGRKLAMVGAGRTFLWDAWSGQALGEIGRGLDWPGEHSAWFSPGGGLVFAADRQSGERWAWDLRAGRVRFDGEYALVSPRDQLALVFDASRSELRWLDGQKSRPAPWLAGFALDYAAFSPDGQRIAVATERGVQIFGLDGAPSRELPLTPAAGPLRFSSDGRFLAGTAHDHVRVWRLSDGALLVDRRLPSAGARPAQARFTGEGLRVLTGHGTVISLSLTASGAPEALDRAADTICATAGGLSPADWRRLLAGLPHRETCD
ncbi:hypothetical protein [Nonomuraea sp. NPDC050310]|uniref:nSTAND1 domain-containing NTPase n=1 Tax=Nonomuraea sp. NPDC050310 TaxID=3154935 RepID=UPI0033D54A70